MQFTSKSAEFFIEIEKVTLKFIRKLKGIQNSQDNLRRTANTFTTSKLTTKLQQSRQCRAGILLNI